LNATSQGGLGFKVEKRAVNEEDIKNTIDGLLKERFKPEFINRVDEIIIFKALSKPDIKRIAELQLAKVAERLAAKKIILEVSDEAKKYIVDKGFDAAFGARPLKRLIQTEVLNPISLDLIKKKYKEGEVVQIDATKDGLAFSKTKLTSTQTVNV